MCHLSGIFDTKFTPSTSNKITIRVHPTLSLSLSLYLSLKTKQKLFRKYENQRPKKLTRFSNHKSVVFDFNIIIILYISLCSRTKIVAIVWIRFLLLLIIGTIYSGIENMAQKKKKIPTTSLLIRWWKWCQVANVPRICCRMHELLPDDIFTTYSFQLDNHCFFHLSRKTLEEVSAIFSHIYALIIW